MAGYGVRTRKTETSNTIAAYPPTGAPRTVPAVSQLEETMSFRTRGSLGTPVDPLVADPYAGFLRIITEGRRKKATEKFGTPQTHSNVLKPTTKFSKENFIGVPVRDNGHPFWATKRIIRTDCVRPGPWHYLKTSGAQQYVATGGPLYACEASILPLFQPQMLFPMGSDLRPHNVFGLAKKVPDFSPEYYTQKAVGTLATTRPDFSLAAFVGELKEGLPTLPGLLLIKQRTLDLKDLGQGAGSEVLNHQFGLTPLISDIQSIIDTLSSASKTILQMEKDAGNGVRRRMSFPGTNTTVSFSDLQLQNQGGVVWNPAYLYPELPKDVNGYLVQGVTAKSIVTQSMVERISFAGSFTNYLPINSDFSSKVDRYVMLSRKLFGPGITPSVLWQLAPWSWLVDWCFDIQTTLSAQEIIADDSLVINYGYVMRHVEMRATQQTTLTPLEDYRVPANVVTSSTLFSRKERLRGNPYGFATKASSGFSLKQLSILAALGVSRA